MFAFEDLQPLQSKMRKSFLFRKRNTHAKIDEILLPKITREEHKKHQFIIQYKCF